MKNKQSVLYLIPKASYYNTEKEMIKEGENLHRDMFEDDRELYTYLLYFKNATYFSKSLIVENLLTNSLYKDECNSLLEKDPKLLKIEDTLIMNALFNENITHALKLLLRLKDKGVNNKRTSKIILRFIFDRGNTDYIAIKYRNKLKQLINHALGVSTAHHILNGSDKGKKAYKKLIAPFNNPYALEVLDFVFGNKREFNSPYLREYMAMKNDFINNTVKFDKPTELPIEVLVGFNNFYNRGYSMTSLIPISNLSVKQKIQMQNTVKKHSNNTMEIKIDLTKYSILALYKYMYNKADITEKEIEEINEIIRDKASVLRDSVKDKFIVDLSDTAIILDASDSNFGSSQTKLHPLYLNLTLTAVLKEPDKKNVFLVGGEIKENGLIYPSGDTDLSSGLIKVAKSGYKNVIVLSDGFENVNSFDKVYKQLNKIGYSINAIHFNPVFSPKNFSFKEISDEIIAMPVAGDGDIENLMLFYLLNTNKDEFKSIMREKIEKELLEK